MPSIHRLRQALLLLAGLFISSDAIPQHLTPPGPAWADWPSYQELAIGPANKLARVELPLETTGALRRSNQNWSELNLILLSPEGEEIPWGIIKPDASYGWLQYNSGTTNISRDGLAVTLEVLGDVTSFVRFQPKGKAFTRTVRVEASPDGKKWDLVADKLTLYHNTNDAYSFLHFPAVSRRWVRLTFDKNTAAPGWAGSASPGYEIRDYFPSILVPAQYTREDVPGETRLVISITPGAFISSFNLNVKDLSFSRPFKIIQRRIDGDSIRGNTILRTTSPTSSVQVPTSISRPAGEGIEPADIVFPTVYVPLELQLMENQILLVIENGSNPPLTIESVDVEYKPITLVFPRPPSGRCLLLAGAFKEKTSYKVRNPVSGMKSSDDVHEKGCIPATPTKFSPLQANPGFRKPAARAAFAGAPINPADGRASRRVLITRPGLQQLDLDFAALAAGSPDFHGMYLSRDKKQIPYLLERDTLHQYLPVPATLVSSGEGNYRWQLQVPQPNLPGDLVVSSSSTFEVMSFEVVEERPGEKRPYRLGLASWVRPKAGEPDIYSIPLYERSKTMTITLLGQSRRKEESFTLGPVQLRVPVCRLHFNAADTRPLSLSTGHRNGRPDYNLEPVAAEMLLAKHAIAALDPLNEPVTRGAASVDTPGSSKQPPSGRKAPVPSARTGHSTRIIWLSLGGIVLAFVAYIAYLARPPRR